SRGRGSPAPRQRSDVGVDQVLDQLLTPASIRRDLALREHVLLERREAVLAGLDLGANARVPRCVSLAEERLELALGTNPRGDLQAASEGIHAADMGVEEIDRLEALAADLRIEVDTAGREAAVLEDHEHDLRRQVDIGRELVGVPTEEKIARVRIDRAEEALRAGVVELVLHRVPGERRVVRLDVELDVLLEPVRAQEVDASRGIE